MTSKSAPIEGGVLLGPFSRSATRLAEVRLRALLSHQGLLADDCILHIEPHGRAQLKLRLRLAEPALDAWAPDRDTLGLAARLDQARGLLVDTDPDRARTQREALVALMASPVDQAFPSLDELLSALRMRAYISRAAAQTAMDFHTAKIDRPMSHWAYDEDTGFTLRAGCDLIEALRITTQPDISGELYAFSCYRATEYILLLGMAQELRECHGDLLRGLQAQWQCQAIASGRFHDTFLHEVGSNEAPLPMRYYVPGDRVWFRNPDETSSDASGYEGSWTMYLGGGLFANMWKRNQPFTLQTKCVEIYHWRDATYRDAEDDVRIDEAVVEREVAATLADAGRTAAVLDRMMRLRDLKGVYADGGCIDRTREGPRWVRPGTHDIPLEPLAAPVATEAKERTVRRPRQPFPSHALAPMSSLAASVAQRLGVGAASTSTGPAAPAT